MRASEAGGQQVKHMASGMDVNAVAKKEEEEEDKAGDHLWKTCFSCRKKGHFSMECALSSKREEMCEVSVRGMAILLCVVTATLHLKRGERLLQRMPPTTTARPIKWDVL